MLKYLFGLLSVVLLLSVSNPYALATESVSTGEATVEGGNAATTALDANWEALYLRLKDDGLTDPAVFYFFTQLPEYAPVPMVVKVKELYKNAFGKKDKPDQPQKPRDPYRIYANVVTADSLQKCQDYLTEHKTAFSSMEKAYGVPKEIVVSLLFVETKLGTYLGKHNAFWSLAAMASSHKPELLQGHLGDLELTEEHDAWLEKHLLAKSSWAYAELKAFLQYCLDNGLSPTDLPGSVYGAIGICQFMPSNLLPYGADGDDDGVIDLFLPSDAIHSAARFLQKHGWQDKPRTDKQRRVLLRYNGLTAYANTILTLAYSVETSKLQTAPPDKPIKKKK